MATESATPRDGSLQSPHTRQLQRGFPGLAFQQPLEARFRRHQLRHSIRRGRLSILVALMLLLALLVIDLLAGTRPGAEVMNTLRITVMLPLVMVMLAVLMHPRLWRYYDATAGLCSAGFGAAAAYGAVTSSLLGDSYLFSGLVLLIVFLFLFLGVLFNTALLTGVVVVGAYLGTGLVLGLAAAELWYQGAILLAAGAMGALGAYNAEYAARATYLESRVLKEQAERDALTGLYNRRIFDDYMQRVWRQAVRERAVLCIVFLDLDYFKLYNDMCGHQAGDDCLQQVARLLRGAALRPFDMCSRYGGEEFVLVLYDPPPDFAESLPERVRSEVAGLGIAHPGSRAADVVTVSIGVAMVRPGESRSLVGAIQMADEALYQAKAEGRNRVVYREGDHSPVITGSFQVERAPPLAAGDDSV